MGAKTGIEWTDHTFNAWRGCTRVAAGCANCYAETLSKRNPGTLGMWGPQGTRVVASESMWRQPLKWDREAAAAGERRRVFCASLADVFEGWHGAVQNHFGQLAIKQGVPESWAWRDADRFGYPLNTLMLGDVRRRLFALIDSTPHLDWLVLTKRPENVLKMWPRAGFPDAGVPGTLGRHLRLPNVWLGTSIACQGDADRNIPALLKCRDLAPVLFLSCEPLVGPVELGRIRPINPLAPCRTDALTGVTYWPENDQDDGPHIDWVIVGGESGPGARPMHPAWARDIRDQCQAAGVPFFFKQWGEWAPVEAAGIGINGRRECVSVAPHRGEWRETELNMYRVGKAAAGRLLDGRTWDEFPSTEDATA